MENSMTDYQNVEFEQAEYDERVIEIGRVAKVVKGGRRFSFRVTVVVGDNRGSVGVGVGKANTVPDAMRKASEHAHRSMHKVNLSGTTIPHEVIARVSGAKVMLKPASAGTGVIAAGGMRAVLEAAGISDILTKSLGSSNVLNVVYATVEALDSLKSAKEEAARRGKDIKDVTPFWERRKNVH
jgi:small subunit ribosomal protein S5